MFSTSYDNSSSGGPLSIKYTCVKGCQCTLPYCAEYHVCIDNLLDDSLQPSLRVSSSVAANVIRACFDHPALALDYVSGFLDAHCGIAATSWPYYILDSSFLYGLLLLTATIFCLHRLLHKTGRLQQRRCTPSPDLLHVGAIAQGIMEICLEASFNMGATAWILKSLWILALSTLPSPVGLTMDGSARVGEVVIL